MTPEEVIRHLTDERTRLGMSLRDVAVAQRSGLTQSRGLSSATLHRYEARHTDPDLYSLEAWANALGYDLVLELKPRRGRYDAEGGG